VTFNPCTLHVDREIWELAELGEPEARFIIAHEVGHLVLHDHNAKAFSNDPNYQIKFAENEHSAEWQANIFAYYFLLPTHIVIAFGNIQELTASCGVNKRLAEERYEAVMWANLRHAKYVPATGYQGDACGNCGNFTLICNGTDLKCDTCGQRQGLDGKAQ
jgi:Zn-dependent peptidase ImmA (M78 family)